MPDFEHRLHYLYQSFISDKATAEEIREFWELIGRAGEDNPIKDSVFALYGEEVPQEVREKSWEGSFEGIINHPGQSTVSKKLPGAGTGKWWAAAASVALLLAAFSYFNVYNRHKGPAVAGSIPVGTKKHDVAPPAANRATILLADGTKIFLDSTGTGMLARQNTIALKKTGDGEIVYDKSTGTPGGEMIYNTLTNPKGSRAISMTLSDGSKLWLNSGSSATFPVAFNGAQRKVSITGEAYFEVAHDPSRKFIVMANRVATEVLGTHFDVNAYGDRDAVKITLLEGSVKVITSDGSSAMLKPGGQGVETLDGKLKTRPQVDLEEVIAWKNEMFSFNNTDIKDLMKEVSRWYDVDIEFKGKFEDLGFGGNMSRQKNVSELLKRLEATQAVKFEVNGRKITVVQTTSK